MYGEKFLPASVYATIAMENIDKLLKKESADFTCYERLQNKAQYR
jgi:hypothetical protein